MKRPLHMAVLVVCASIVALPARAECDLSRVVGYTLIAAKTVARYVDEKPGSTTSTDGFEGCDFDRIIVFADGTGVRCASYGYQYAYNPKAYIFSRGNSMRMCVGNTLYDITSIRG